MDNKLLKLERAFKSDCLPTTYEKLQRARRQAGIFQSFNEPNGTEVWIHLIVIEEDNKLTTILPEQNLGPHYNRRRYGYSKIPKGRRTYKSKQGVRKAVAHKSWYPGEIVFASDEMLIYRYDRSNLPKDVSKMCASVFLRQKIDVARRANDFL